MKKLNLMILLGALVLGITSCNATPQISSISKSSNDSSSPASQPCLEHNFGDDHICDICQFEDESKKLKIEYQLNEDGESYKITYGENVPEDFVIPETYEGKPVTVIGSYAFEGKNIKSLIIPNSIITIEDRAFGFNPLYKVIIGSSVKTIGRNAFMDARVVELVNKSRHYTSIESGFEMLTKLITELDETQNPELYEELLNEYINLADIVAQNVFENPELGRALYTYLNESYESKLTTEGDYLVVNDGENKILINYLGSESEISIPSGITKLNHSAFLESELTKIILPETLIEIDDYAFRRCRKLKGLTIPKSVKKIGRSFLAECSQFEYIIFEGEEIEEYSYDTLTIDPESLKSIFFKGNPIEIVSNYGSLYKRESYIYSETVNLKGNGQNYWHYNNEGTPVAWDVKRQNYYFGDHIYSYKNTEVSISDELWSELTSKKGTPELNELLNNNSDIISAFNESTSKEDFKSKIIPILTNECTDFTITFGVTGIIDHFTDSRTEEKHNIIPFSVDGVFGAYAYDYETPYLFEIEENTISYIETGYSFVINHILTKSN